MLDKIKDLGSQVASKANIAVDGITTSVKGGVGSMASAASTATSSLNEKAVRASTAQMCRILEIALEEMKGRPIAERRISLTATVNIGIAALEMQVHVDPLLGEVPADVPVPRSQSDAEKLAEGQLLSFQLTPDSTD